MSDTSFSRWPSEIHVPSFQGLTAVGSEGLRGLEFRWFTFPRFRACEMCSSGRLGAWGGLYEFGGLDFGLKGLGFSDQE